MSVSEMPAELPRALLVPSSAPAHKYSRHVKRHGGLFPKLFASRSPLLNFYFSIRSTHLPQHLPSSPARILSNRSMTSRELRNQRREAERKARKLEYRQNLRGAGSLAGEPVVEPAAPCMSPTAGRATGSPLRLAAPVPSNVPDV